MQHLSRNNLKLRIDFWFLRNQVCDHINLNLLKLLGRFMELTQVFLIEDMSWSFLTFLSCE